MAKMDKDDICELLTLYTYIADQLSYRGYMYRKISVVFLTSIVETINSHMVCARRARPVFLYSSLLYILVMKYTCCIIALALPPISCARPRVSNC